ncbi:unnamed protein product [Parascedosporium putredinis]|uniref:Uncharacterized protein n=1 Tax=Parascedosporium putredinis TaxID=1442378 RepID=A0A9P1GUD8_9PEZI|nr:unnamed protein product [Parascedosporium putredinis]CAI7987555.1 unnamed protein product [Parascedosporium putredinis]
MLTRRLLQTARLSSLRVARLVPGAVPRSALRQPQRFSSGSAKPPSVHSTFYKTFGRPIAKVVLLSILTYQAVYLLWIKLEADETKSLRKAEIAELESKVEKLQGSNKS